MIELFGHPFSSYTWKALIPFYENDTPFTFRIIDDDHPENRQRLNGLSPQRKFPLLVEGGISLFESSIIIEYLQQYHPGPVTFIPDDFDAALQVRMLDRFFDHYVMNISQHIVDDFLRQPVDRNAVIVAQAKKRLERSYAWLEQRMRDMTWACGEEFTLADCAAAPALFYADWLYEISGEYPAVRDYRSHLLARPSVKRCVEDARPYRRLLPGGAPDRD